MLHFGPNYLEALGLLCHATEMDKVHLLRIGPLVQPFLIQMKSFKFNFFKN